MRGSTVIRRGVILAAAGILLSSVWYLFGFKTESTGDGWKWVLHRSFGRVTRIDHFRPANGSRPFERIVFPWSEPYEGGDPMTSCASIFPELWQDRNGDGKWDTWAKRVGPDADGECRVRYEVDTSGSGKPDWVFVADLRDYEKASQAIIARRGF